MKTALLGGSFNPLHLGHLQLADELRHRGYGRVLLVPANIPAHKRSPESVEPLVRLEMTRAAALAYGFEVSDCEIQRGGVSYTIDTVRYIRETFNPEGAVGIVIGEDLIADFHTWKQYKELLAEAELLVARRGSVRLDRNDISYSRLDNPDFPVSSTEIRNRIAEGRAYRFLLPPEVYRFIRERGLYRGDGEVGR
jgi:nicotinate-nucleotide adenylyltransferase